MNPGIQNVVLLTGATGMVGREILQRIARSADSRVLCLIRAVDDAEARARLDRTIQEMPHRLSPERRACIDAVAGDLTRERFGLSRQAWEKLAEEVTRIVHGAASVTWNLPIETVRQINVEGTQRMLELAVESQRRGRFRKFDYLGTTMVAGRRTGLIGEEELDDSYGFFNTYEQSKWEAEKLVRTYRDSLPVSIYRLSMVVGDSKTGYTSAFNVMYWPLKMMSRGMFWFAPADPQGIVDIVPVDYLCDALEELSADPKQIGKCFHLAAGPERCCTIGEILDLAVQTFKVRRPILMNPRTFFLFVRPLLYAVTWGRKREVMKTARVYLPYLSFQAKFSTEQTRAALEPKGLVPPTVREYFQTLVDYAIRTDWGKRCVAAAAADQAVSKG
jgi:long-chain acyl-CoA synthetase